MTTEVLDLLTTTETARLGELETIVAAGVESFIATGEALAEIRDAQLYRATHGSFEAYIGERWPQFGRRQADRLIAAARVNRNLRPMGLSLGSERQARELARLTPEQQVAAMSAAQAAAGERAPTGAEVTRAAEQVAPKPANPDRLFDLLAARDWRAAVAWITAQPTGEAREIYERLFAQVMSISDHLAAGNVASARRTRDRIAMGPAAAWPMLARLLAWSDFDPTAKAPPAPAPDALGAVLARLAAFEARPLTADDGAALEALQADWEAIPDVPDEDTIADWDRRWLAQLARVPSDGAPAAPTAPAVEPWRLSRDELIAAYPGESLAPVLLAQLEAAGVRYLGSYRTWDGHARGPGITTHAITGRFTAGGPSTLEVETHAIPAILARLIPATPEPAVEAATAPPSPATVQAAIDADELYRRAERELLELVQWLEPRPAIGRLLAVLIDPEGLDCTHSEPDAGAVAESLWESLTLLAHERAAMLPAWHAACADDPPAPVPQLPPMPKLSADGASDKLEELKLWKVGA